MGLGLALIFGQMGVINMAHGEFMAMGAYTVYLCSSLTASYAPSFGPYYFYPGHVIALQPPLHGADRWSSGVLIRHLYHRPLDTLLATWGLSLIMQQSYRSIFGAREVTPTSLSGSWDPSKSRTGLDIPINGVFVLCLAIAVTVALVLSCIAHASDCQAARHCAESDHGGRRRNQHRPRGSSRLRPGLRHRGHRRRAFTTIGSTGPTSGQLYIVDCFLVVVFGGAANMLGTIASAFAIAQTQSMLEFFIDGTEGEIARCS